ncbi:MAG: IS256 family transposase [Chloroflexi bacterium]|nr:IS256 family transposase [Chloroflexota bacterium]
MVQVKDLTQLTVADLWKAVKENPWEEITQEQRRFVRRMIEELAEAELVEHLQATWYQRSPQRRGYRNGYRLRDLVTQWGLLENLRVPRDREGAFQSRVVDRYQRYQPQVEATVREMFLRGVSTRQVETVVAPLLGTGLSAQTVSRMTRALDAEVQRFHRRPLVDAYQYLLFDGVTLKVKGASGVKKKLLLCAYGITVGGTRELLAFRHATAESEAQWEAFLRDLYQRGLEGSALQLITIDGSPGLRKALLTVYPYVPVQRCWVHKLRNVAAKLPRKWQEGCLRGLRPVYLAETEREARAQFRAWAAQWRERAPRAVTCVAEDLDELVSFLACPKAHWRKIRTTNAIERAFREVRRRTRPMSCFQNGASVDRIVYGVICHLNTAWKEKPLPEFTPNS